jgi:hypothetical protein
MKFKKKNLCFSCIIKILISLKNFGESISRSNQIKIDIYNLHACLHACKNMHVNMHVKTCM